MREATTPPAWIMQPPPTGRHRWTGLFHPRERLITMQNNWKEPRSILMSSADRVAHIDGQLIIIVSNIHVLPAEYKCLKCNKTEQSIYECLLGFCFNNIFCAATNFGCIDSFLLPNSRNEETWWWFPLVLLLPVCFEQTSVEHIL